MTKGIDELLNQLAAAPEPRSLAGLEPAVWRRIESRRTAATFGGGLRLQMAVAVGALVLGVGVSGAMTGPRGSYPSEMVVLSEDAHLAPSVAVLGGA